MTTNQKQIFVEWITDFVESHIGNFPVYQNTGCPIKNETGLLLNSLGHKEVNYI